MGDCNEEVGTLLFLVDSRFGKGVLVGRPSESDVESFSFEEKFLLVEQVIAAGGNK